MNLSDIKFDHDADCTKIRKMGAGVTYVQDGVEFSSGFVPLRILEERIPKDEFDDMSPAELRAALRQSGVGSPKKKRADAQESPRKKKTRADKKPAPADDKLEGFRTADQPDYVQQALSENHAAIMAEEHAES